MFYRIIRGEIVAAESRHAYGATNGLRQLTQVPQEVAAGVFAHAWDAPNSDAGELYIQIMDGHDGYDTPEKRAVALRFYNQWEVPA